MRRALPGFGFVVCLWAVLWIVGHWNEGIRRFDVPRRPESARALVPTEDLQKTMGAEFDKAYAKRNSLLACGRRVLRWGNGTGWVCLLTTSALTFIASVGVGRPGTKPQPIESAAVQGFRAKPVRQDAQPDENARASIPPPTMPPRGEGIFWLLFSLGLLAAVTNAATGQLKSSAQDYRDRAAEMSETLDKLWIGTENPGGYPGGATAIRRDLDAVLAE